MIQEGMEVSALAYAHVPISVRLPERLHELRLNFLGLLGTRDPVRPGVLASIKEAVSSGIRVVIITRTCSSNNGCNFIRRYRGDS